MRLSSLVLLISAMLITGVLTAQVSMPADPVPLRNWAAPTYWQPSPQESTAIKSTNSWFSARTSENDAAPQGPINPASGLVFVGMTPCRVIDTRTASAFPSPFGPPILSGGIGRAFPMQQSTRCSIPATANAYSVNVTVIPSAPFGYLTIWPTGVAMPVVSTLNDPLGIVVANAAVVPAGTPYGSVSLYATGQTDVVVDINGYYVTPTTPYGEIVTSDNNNGLTSAPPVTCSTPGNIAASSAISISATNHYVLMKGSAAVGSTSTSGATGLDLYPCYLAPGASTWTMVSSGIFGLAIAQNGRMTIATNWIFGPYATTGTYKFGMCARQCGGSGTWNSNEYFTITSLVYTQSYMTSAPIANVQTR